MMLSILNNAKRLYQLKLNQILPKYKRYIYDDILNSTAKITEPDKLYLNNTNLFNALCNEAEMGTIREVYFISMLKKYLIGLIIVI